MADNRKFYKLGKHSSEFRSYEHKPKGSQQNKSSSQQNVEGFEKVDKPSSKYLVRKKFNPKKEFSPFIYSFLDKELKERPELADEDKIKLIKHFIACVHEFTYKFIRLFEKELTPSPGVFSNTLFENPNNFNGELTIGTKFMPNFAEWAQCFEDIDEMQTGKIFGGLIDEDGYVIKNQKRMPIKDLAAGAVLIVILQIEDPNEGNFGLEEKDLVYQTKLIDLQAFSSKPQVELCNIQNETIKTPCDILSVYFKCDEYGDEVPALPKVLLDSKYLHDEIIESLKALMCLVESDKVDKLVEHVFRNYPQAGKELRDIVKANVKQLYKQIQPEIKEQEQAQVQLKKEP